MATPDQGSPAPLYNSAILRLAAHIPHAGRLDPPCRTITRTSPICGSRIIADMEMDAAGRVVRFAQDVRACALGQAAAAILGGRIIGLGTDDLIKARDALENLLKQADAPIPPDWPDFALLAPALPYKGRHGSILLAFQAAVDLADMARVTG